MQTLKVFAPKTEYANVLKVSTLVEKYDAFLVVEADDMTVASLSKRYPVEDITAQYNLHLGGAAPRTPKTRADYRGEVALARGPHHYVIQFIGPIKRAWLTKVVATGAKLRAPYGGFAHVIWARESMLPKINALPFVRWVGHLPFTCRIAPPSEELPRQRTREGVYSVEIFAGDDTGKIARSARALGFKVLTEDAKAKLLLVASEATAKIRRDQVKSLSAVHGVRLIRERVVKRTSNNVATTVMGNSYTASSSAGLKLTGEGEVVAVCDTGIDSGDPSNLHPDFAGRLLAVKSYPITPDWNSYIINPGADDGPADLDSGHGTHVSGSVLGDGTASAGSVALIRGHAFKAKLVFQAVEQEMKWKPTAPANLKGERYVLAGLPANLQPLFQFAYNQGARIHSNSWGGGQPGAYDDQCRQFDQFVWDHKDFCFVIAAGNDGTDKDGDGKINLGSVTSPGTSKNCITVGACENRRPEFNSQTYGAWWPGDFPAPPIHNDPMANDPGQVVAFSSRGPTSDGRTKPEVVAPGTFILSTRSSMLAPNNFGWSAYPPDKKHYFFDGGTSMATPLTSGAVALLRQFLRLERGIASPSAALVKALLIAGATRVPKTAPTGAIVDNHQGFGRVNLDGSTKTPLATIDGPGLSTGQKSTFAIQVPSAGKTLRVSMCYSDFPGDTLVNNLNLIVTSPSGKRYTGNQPTSGGTLAMDSSNNTEVVVVKKAAKGNWTVDVVASNVSMGSQDFGLAAVLM
ncbi:MAG: S8 family serine peptidase [Thiobacillaceae bacterium]